MTVSGVDIQCRDFLFVSRSPHVLCLGTFLHIMKPFHEKTHFWHYYSVYLCTVERKGRTLGFFSNLKAIYWLIMGG